MCRFICKKNVTNVFGPCLSHQPEEATEPISTLVPFLQKYSDVRNKKPTVSVSFDIRQRSHKISIHTPDTYKTQSPSKPPNAVCDQQFTSITHLLSGKTRKRWALCLSAVYTQLFLFSYCSLLHQVLKLELKEIREQQDLLFRFMNFLKQEGAVHVLQFCLTVGAYFDVKSGHII